MPIGVGFVSAIAGIVVSVGSEGRVAPSRAAPCVVVFFEALRAVAIGIVSVSAAHEQHPDEGHLVAGEQVAIIRIGVDALQLESAAPVVVVGTGDAVVVVVVSVSDVTREDPLVVVILEEVDAGYIAALVVIKRVDEVINFAFVTIKFIIFCSNLPLIIFQLTWLRTRSDASLVPYPESS